MKKRILTLVVAVAAATPLVAAETTRYMVATRGPARIAQIGILRDAADALNHEVREFASVNAFAADLTAAEVAELRRSPDVRYLTPVVERSMHAIGASAPFKPATEAIRHNAQQTVPYGVDMVNAKHVWTAGKGGAGAVNVAIFDTGIDYDHPDLKTAYKGGYNTFNQTEDPKDDNRHGTHVAGTIAARDNAFGVVGVAPEAKLWAIKVLNRNGNGTDENIVAGIDWLLAKKRVVGGNWIMSLSLGATQPSDIEREAYRRAMDAGVLVVASSGNRGMAAMEYPAAYEGVIGVGAVNDKRERTRFSSYASTLSLMAPGLDVLSTMPVGMFYVADFETLDVKGDGSGLIGSPKKDVRGQLIACGIGEPKDFPVGGAGYVALIKRGEITFAEKIRNAKAAGAFAAIVYNGTVEDEQKNDINSWTLIRPDCANDCKPWPDDVSFDWILTVGTNMENGRKLLEKANAGATVVVSHRAEDYANLSGTSMSTPHVSGIAAMIWSLAPNATAGQVKTALTQSATDIGAPGFDQFTGFGIVDAFGAAKFLAPQLFGSGATPTPTPVPPRRRS